MNSFTLTEIPGTKLTPTEIQFFGSDSVNGARFIRFKNAVLARAEVNKNRDEVTEQGIEELAATLPGTAIDDEHQKGVNVGFFEGARKAVENGLAVLSTDGTIWADRYPSQAADVLAGRKLTSIEAGAEKAVCSVCGRGFTTDALYCNHLKSRLMDGVAVRKLQGLRAKGGAITTHPAGTDTRFDFNHIELVASIWGQDNVEAAYAEDDGALAFYSELEYEFWRTQPEKAMTWLGKALTSEERKNMPASKFAVTQKRDGKTVKRFPINDCEHARKALQLLSKAQDLSDAERAEITRRARAKLDSPACRNGAQGALQMFRACMPMVPGMVQYRPVFSPLMFTNDPPWLAKFKPAMVEGRPLKPERFMGDSQGQEFAESAEPQPPQTEIAPQGVTSPNTEASLKSEQSPAPASAGEGAPKPNDGERAREQAPILGFTLADRSVSTPERVRINLALH